MAYGGFQPWGPVLRATRYTAASQATGHFRGDAVRRVAAGTVEDAAAGGPILGAIIGCEDSNKNPVAYVPANTSGYYVIVADHSDQLYIVEEDGDTTPIALADRGAAADLVLGAGGDTATGLSSHKLDSSSAAGGTGADVQCRIIDLAPVNGNAIGNTNPYPKWIVTMQEHQMGDNIAGI